MKKCLKQINVIELGNWLTANRETIESGGVTEALVEKAKESLCFDITINNIRGLCKAMGIEKQVATATQSQFVARLEFCERAILEICTSILTGANGAEVDRIANILKARLGK